MEYIEWKQDRREIRIKKELAKKGEFFVYNLMQVILLLLKTVLAEKQGKVLQIVDKVAEYKEVEKGLQFRIQKTKIWDEKLIRYEVKEIYRLSSIFCWLVSEKMVPEVTEQGKDQSEATVKSVNSDLTAFPLKSCHL